MKKVLSSALLAASMAASSLSMAGGALIVSPESQLQSAEQTEVSRLFLGRGNDLGGIQVVPVNQEENEAVRKAFEEDVLGKSGARLRSYWSRLVFTGKAKPPVVIGDDEKVIEHVLNNPDAVGYISAESVNDSVKVIFEF
jgi:hypothetical protein